MLNGANTAIASCEIVGTVRRSAARSSSRACRRPAAAQRLGRRHARPTARSRARPARRILVSVAGPDARAMLAKLSSIDLHPAAFPAGSAAATSIEHTSHQSLARQRRAGWPADVQASAVRDVCGEPVAQHRRCRRGVWHRNPAVDSIRHGSTWKEAVFGPRRGEMQSSPAALSAAYAGL